MTIELAKRAVACSRWALSPRMHAFREMEYGDVGPSCTVILLDGPVAHVVWDQGSGRLKPIAAAELLPDLSDPASIGCLLALVREAWGVQTLTTNYCDGMDQVAWAVVDAKNRPMGYGATEAEALVAALEAAP
jgi:hypothetical protein